MLYTWCLHLFLLSTSDLQDDEHDHKMPQEKLILLTSFQPILDYLVTCDHILYQCIINFLIPNVLKPIPATLTQAVRNFAKSLESWMKGCLDSYMANCVESKVIDNFTKHTQCN